MLAWGRGRWAVSQKPKLILGFLLCVCFATCRENFEMVAVIVYLKRSTKKKKKTCNIAATLLQNELKSSVARFTTHQSNLSCNKINKVVAGCEKLLQKVQSRSTFCNKICTCCAFTGPRQTCFLASDVTIA